MTPAFHRPQFSEFLAEHIAGAQLRVLDGADTLAFLAGDVAPVLDAVEQLLTGRRDPARSDHVLATVLFTDTVTSTAVRDRWVISSGWTCSRSTTGSCAPSSTASAAGGRDDRGRCLATFDGPTRAVACAARVMAQGRDGGVLVSSAVRDLVVGTAMAFRPGGTFALRGVAGEWRPYELDQVR